MAKRLVSVLLAVLLVFAASAVAFADSDDPDSSAGKLYFDTNSVGWTGFNSVGFHIWPIDDDDFVGFDWGGKSQRGEDPDGDGIWEYDLSKLTTSLAEGKQYAVIFYNDLGQKTYNLLFDTTCIGDIAYGDTSNMLENPEDSGKTAIPAFWRNQDPAVNGPELKITSVGNVVGTCIAKSRSAVSLLVDFLTNTLENVHEFTDLSDQELIDNIGNNLKMTREDVKQALAIYEKVLGPVAWDEDASSLPGKDDTPALRGDYDRDGEITILDATRVQRIIAELVEDYDEAYCIGIDADNDGEMTILDATRVQRVIAELCDWDGNPPMILDEYELPAIGV